MRQTLDAMDGKQARRTGSSSPLGELLDHGVCDAIEILVRGVAEVVLFVCLFVLLVLLTFCIVLVV
jgi:phosphatidylglycerophosphate synthase